MEQKKFMDISRAKFGDELTQSNTGGFEVGDIIQISEKWDGCNASIRYDIDTGELKAFSRKTELSFNKTLNGFWNYVQSKNETKEELKLVLFDVLPKEEFDKGISSDTYKIRKQKLISLKAFETENLQIVDMFYEGTDQSEIWKWLDYAEKHDMEGLMLSLDAPYECKRTKTLLKVKKFYDFDLRIGDVEEGTGRNKGRLGAFVVDYKGNYVNVGSGFTDKERDNFWGNRENLIGRVITVKYKEISKDKKTGLESLQFPIYCGLREQGKEVSYN